MRPSSIAASALLLSSACAAWPSGWEDAVRIVKREIAEIAPLVRRQTTSFNLSLSTLVQGDTATATRSGSATASATDDSSSTNSDDATTTNSDDSSSTDSSDSSETGTTTATGRSSGTRRATGTITEAPTSASTGGLEFANGTSAQSFDARLPAGGISMITPNPLSTQFYKINNYVTFAWNYTSVSKYPTAVDILAVGSTASVTYTLAINESVTASTQAFTWDTNAWQANATVSLVTDKYTLVVYDAAKGVSATPSPGYLGMADQFTFGMYSPSAAATTGAPFQCATCSGAMSQAERQTILAILSMAGLTVLSFGWFTGVAGLW